MYYINKSVQPKLLKNSHSLMVHSCFHEKYKIQNYSKNHMYSSNNAVNIKYSKTGLCYNHVTIRNKKYHKKNMNYINSSVNMKY